MIYKKLRKNLNLSIIGDNPAPFESFFHSDKIVIRFNGNEPVSVNHRTKSFYDCYHVKNNGDSIVDVMVPLLDKLNISDRHGNKWVLKLDYNKIKVIDSFHDFISHYTSLVKGFFSSFLVHCLIALIFTAVYFGAQKFDSIREFIGLKSESIKSLQASMEISAKKEATPFSGMGLREYIDTYIDNKRPEEKVKAAVQSISNISNVLNKDMLKGISGKIGGVAGGTNLPKLDTKTLVADSLKELRNHDAESAKKVIVKSSASLNQVPAPQYDKKEMIIRATLQTLKPKLSANFDEALRVDPNLSVTLTYDALIDSNGRLVNIKLIAKGSGASLAIETLKKKALLSFEGLQFSKECAGTPIHGEQVFIK